jgi:hypothetical protein
VKQLRGTMRKDRSHPREVPVLNGALRIPPWLEGRALDLWREKTASYSERGMSVKGCESMLALLCAYEAIIVEKLIRGEEPTASMLNAVKTLAGQFYDTPSTQVSKEAVGPQCQVDAFWDRFR